MFSFVVFILYENYLDLKRLKVTNQQKKRKKDQRFYKSLKLEGWNTILPKDIPSVGVLMMVVKSAEPKSPTDVQWEGDSEGLLGKPNY